MSSVVQTKRLRPRYNRWTPHLAARLAHYWNVDKLTARQILDKPEFSAFSTGALWDAIRRLRQAGAALTERSTSPPYTSPWTPERLTKLAFYWNRGDSAGMIAQRPEFSDVTRNAIIGKLCRLRKTAGTELRDFRPAVRRVASSHLAVAHRIGQIKRRRRLRVSPSKLVAVVPPTLPPGCKGVSFVDHPAGACSFPLEGTGMMALWCDQPATCGSYCAFHDAAAHGRPTQTSEIEHA